MSGHSGCEPGSGQNCGVETMSVASGGGDHRGLKELGNSLSIARIHPIRALPWGGLWTTLCGLEGQLGGLDRLRMSAVAGAGKLTWPRLAVPVPRSQTSTHLSSSLVSCSTPGYSGTNTIINRVREAPALQCQVL